MASVPKSAPPANLRDQLIGASLYLRFRFAGQTQENFRKFDRLRFDEFGLIRVEIFAQLVDAQALE